MYSGGIFVGEVTKTPNFGGFALGCLTSVCTAAYIGTIGYLQRCSWLLASIHWAWGFSIQSVLADDSYKAGLAQGKTWPAWASEKKKSSALPKFGGLRMPATTSWSFATLRVYMLAARALADALADPGISQRPYEADTATANIELLRKECLYRAFIHRMTEQSLKV